MFIAEREGFEPPDAFTSTVFKTAVIESTTLPPLQSNMLYLFFQKERKDK